MPLDIFNEVHGTRWECRGIVTNKEITEANQLVYQNVEKLNHWYHLIDMREMEELIMDEMDIVNISIDDAAFSRKYPDFKLAIVISDPLLKEKIIKYMMVSWTINTNWDIRVYNNIEAARDWFNVPGWKKKENPDNLDYDRDDYTSVS